MVLARILAYVDSYALWLYAALFLAVLFSALELRQAQKGRSETIFSLEREFATARESRARSALVAGIALVALLTVFKFGLIPASAIPTPEKPTSTPIVMILPTPVPPTPTPTRTRIPTRPLPTRAPETPVPTATVGLPASCPNPGIRIASPAMNQAVQGEVTVRGTANIAQFQFYKIEYGMGEEPREWHSIGEIVRAPVTDGVIAMWNVAGFPSGPFKLRLTVVDASGNFPPPCEVRVVVQP